MDTLSPILPDAPILLPAPQIRVVVQPSPFRAAAYEFFARHGSTLLELLLETDLARVADDGAVELAGDIVITVGREEPFQRFWHVYRPRPDALVVIHMVPGDSRQAILIGGLVAITALAIAAPYAAPALLPGVAGAGLIGAAAGAAISIGGYTALNAFLPYEQPESDVDNAQSINSVTSQSNRVERWARIPVILANTIRVVPNAGASPYTEPAGNDKYLRILLTVGQGPLEITGIEVGGTAIDDLSSDIDYEIREGRSSEDPLTLFTRDPVEINPAASLGEIKAGNKQVQTTATDTTEISLDVEWPLGIYHQGKQSRDPYSVVYTIEISVSGADTWTDFETGSGTLIRHTERHETSNLIRRNHRRTITAGQYDIRIDRVNGDGGDTNPSAMFWSSLRSFQPNDPRTDTTLACIALRVKKTGNSTVPAISCLVGTYALDWNGAAWVEAVTNNPASLGRHLLQGSAQINPVADSRMDLTSWEEFHEFCDDEGFVFNGILEREGRTLEAIQSVLAAGRGRLIRTNGLYGVAIDRADKSIVGSISPRNSFDMRATHRLSPVLHGFRCLFYNEEKDFQPDERLVFDDGIDEESADYGKIEVLDLTERGITHTDLVWRHARYRIAERKLRPAVYSVKQGKRARKYAPGDLVAYQSDIALIGLGGGRILSVTTDGGGDVTAVTIDDDVTMEMGGTYQARVTFVDDSDVDQYMVRAVDTVPGTTRTLTFSESFPAGTVPAIGDELLFGVTDLSDIRCIVRDIYPGQNDTREIILIDEAPGIFTADQGTIPDWDSQITRPLDFYGSPPAAPTISTVVYRNIAHPAQPDIITQQQLIVHLAAIGTSLQPPAGYDVEIKRSDEPIYQRRYSFPPDAAELTIEIVQSDASYDVRVRALGQSPRGFITYSEWSAVSTIYVPLPEVTFATTAQVAGLELQGQGNDVEFLGPDAHFVWRITATSGSFQIHGGNEQLIGFVDPQFAWYEVKVIDPATSYVRRIVTTTTPQFVYGIADNKEDSRKQAAVLGGSNRPLREFTVLVKFTDRFGRQGPGQSLTVSNPAPEAPAGLIVSGKVLAINVRTDPPDDDDFEATIVYVGATSGFDPASPMTAVFKDLSNVVLIADQPGGVTKFVRVAHSDRFSEQVADLNLSSEIAVVIEAPEGPPRFTSEGIRFQPIGLTNTVSWTSGTIYVQDGATVTPEPVLAGQATWTSGTLWLYYVRGFGAIQATTNAALAQQPDRVALALYRGGLALTRTTGDIPIANVVTVGAGASSNPSTEGFATLLTLDPIIVAGNPVLVSICARTQGTQFYTGSGQKKITSQIQLRRDGVTINAAEVARGTAAFYGPDIQIAEYSWAGTLQFVDEPGPGTFVYSAHLQNARDGGNATTNSTSVQGISMSATEALY